jgi:hypothetical protein
MLAADLTYKILAFFKNYVAKSALVKHWAAAAIAHFKACAVLFFPEVRAHTLAHDTAHIFVYAESFFVYVNVPSDAAGVAARARNAMEFFVVIWCVGFHFYFSVWVI